MSPLPSPRDPFATPPLAPAPPAALRDPAPLDAGRALAWEPGDEPW